MVLNEYAERLAVSLRLTEDTLVRDMLAATSSTVDAVGGVNGDSPTEITTSDVDDVVQALLSADAYTLMDNIQGENKFGTGPVRNAYLSLSHTNMSASLNSTGGFLHASQYPSMSNLLKAEWGSINNVRFLLTSNGSYSPNSSNLGQDVYNNFIVGMESFGCIDQENASAQFIYRPPYLNDPLAQNFTIGWKAGLAQRILNDEWIVNLRTTLA